VQLGMMTSGTLLPMSQLNGSRTAMDVTSLGHK